MRRTIGQLTAEIREINIEKGWRPAGGGPGDVTWGDKVALLHSEVSEALEAYRDHRLEDATVPLENGHLVTPGGEYDSLVPGVDYQLPKPEGVGSELADVLIRLLDMCDAFGLAMPERDETLDEVGEPAEGRVFDSFGENMAWLHYTISGMWVTRSWQTRDLYPEKVLRALVAVARAHDIDLDAEVERKIAYNRTRSFRHGGRVL